MPETTDKPKPEVGPPERYVEVMLDLPEYGHQVKAFISVSNIVQEVFSQILGQLTRDSEHQHLFTLTGDSLSKMRAEVKSRTSSEEYIRAIARAIDVLGPEQAETWMKERVPSLGNKTPRDILLEPGGPDKVLTVLGRIEHGIF